LRCTKCSSPILAVQTNIGNEAVGDIYDMPQKLFPEAKYRANPNAPRNIQIAFDEAYTCYRNRAYTAAALLCRKTMEGICRAHDVGNNNLMMSLKKMKDQNLIDERLFEWSDALRHAGNEAAHDVDVNCQRG
jgi:hypothetical protein